ncbi:hypothetical protein [Deinococcus enclensis]|uniref:Uncharacterized protein n=1 Tax=Deinococcus enclensis TaxID=1049582 RepID=A0ABT9ME67_9DEIO|nr:hypothetical protein [Deinococcus enclensis]MDP9764888.1 hypothetical protein [Deinococcus enclensis]
MSELLGGQTTQEARPVVGEGGGSNSQLPTPPAPASEPQTPKRWRTLRTPDGQRPSPRQAQRDARQYAEAWYQALKKWKVESYEVATPTGSGRGGAVFLTTGTPGFLTCYYLDTPLGRKVTAVEVGRTISTWAASPIPAQRLHGLNLERLRGDVAMASLLHHSGRGWANPSDRAKAYAAAVLTLAVSLGDANASTYLPELSNARD